MGCLNPALSVQFFADLLAALLNEAAHRAGQRGDHRDRPDLHEDVERATAEGDRVFDVGGDGQELRARPEERAAQRPDLGFLRVPLEQERRRGADEIDADRRHGDCSEVVAQAAMRRGRSPCDPV
jgi:hypothetical protein